MSAFCSNTLIFAQDTGNAFLEAKISNFFQGGMPPDPPSFSIYSKAVVTYL